MGPEEVDVKIWPGYKMRLTRSEGSRSGSSKGAAWAALAAATVALVTTVSASAATPASLNVTLSTVAQAVKSVTISPTSTSYTNCLYGTSTPQQLGFPDAMCAGASPITVTNGATTADILINGADMVPADNGTHWRLCSYIGGDTPVCTGGQPSGPQVPGVDEYVETTSPSTGFPLAAPFGPGPFFALKTTTTCDRAGVGCAAAPGAQATEYLALAAGPSSSTDPSTSWSTSVTWTAS